MLSNDEKRVLKSTITAMTTQVLVHLRTKIRENALEIGQVDLASQQTVRFDTTPRIALEAVRQAYVGILDDPKALEALKKELSL